MKRYWERKQVPLLPRPGDDSFVVDVTTLFYSFIGAALKKNAVNNLSHLPEPSAASDILVPSQINTTILLIRVCNKIAFN